MSRECTTAGMQEVEPCREQLPMDARSDRFSFARVTKELVSSGAALSYISVFRQVGFVGPYGFVEHTCYTFFHLYRIIMGVGDRLAITV